MDTCELCGKHEDERNTQEQMGYTICLGCDGLYSDEELEERMEPIHWDDYYSHLDIPKHWINSSYPNDELPSFICNEFQIWINSPSLKERKENYAHLGQSEEFKDWIFVVTFEKNYGVEVNDLLYTKNFQELLDFVGGDHNG